MFITFYLNKLKRGLDLIIGAPVIFLFGLFADHNSSIKSDILPKKILIIKLAAVGDTILLIPVIRSLREKFPDTEIDWLTSPINLQIAKTVPYVNHIWCIKKDIVSFLSVICNLRKKGYDMVIDFEQWARGTAIISFASGAAIRIGFDTEEEYRGWSYTTSYKKRYDRHELFEFYSLIEGLIGSVPKSPCLFLWETDKGREEIDSALLGRLADNSKLIVIHPGCGSDGLPREWGRDRFSSLTKWLIKTYHPNIIFTSGREERYKIEDIIKPLKEPVINLGGILSWEGMISLVNRADLVISGNTGVMHIAAAFKKPQIALHGPTNPILWGPFDNPNASILSSNCPKCPSLRLGFEYHSLTQECMDTITLDEVKGAVERIFKKSL